MEVLKETPHLIAYIDLLGVKELIKSDSSQYSLNTINSLYDLMKNFPEKHNFKLLNELTFRAFSDNFILSLPISNDDNENRIRLEALSMYVAVFQLSYLTSFQILCRGCITFGNFFVNENIVWGEALIRGYTVESSIAIYPRVLLDIENDEICKLSKGSKIINKYYYIDNDGQVCLNCFHNRIISVMYEKSKNLQDIEKVFEAELNITKNNEKAHQKWNWAYNAYMNHKEVSEQDVKNE